MAAAAAAVVVAEILRPGVLAVGLRLIMGATDLRFVDLPRLRRFLQEVLFVLMKTDLVTVGSEES